VEHSRPVRARGRLSVVVGTIAMALMFAALAYADDIANTLDASVDANFEAMALNVGGGTGSTTLVVVTRSGDGKNGCNLTGSTTLGVSVASSNPGVATVSPASLTFGSCGDVKTITVTPVATGTADVTVSQTSNTTGATFNFAPASFTVTVAPPPNTAPVVQVTGVTHGSTYDHGSVPAAGCLVSDVEDGLTNSTSAATPTLGPFSGLYARPRRLVSKRCHADVARPGATVAFVAAGVRVCRSVDHGGSVGDDLQLLGDERGRIVWPSQRGDQARRVGSNGQRNSVHTSQPGGLVQERGHPQLDVR
jgi:hypothetical protein